MTLSTLKQSIYSSLCGHEGTTADIEKIKMEAMFNLMQATFITLQSSLSLDNQALAEGQQIFHILFTRYFQEKMEVSIDG